MCDELFCLAAVSGVQKATGVPNRREECREFVE